MKKPFDQREWMGTPFALLRTAKGRHLMLPGCQRDGVFL